MPRASRICNKLGCPDIATTNGNYCDTHKPATWVKHNKRPHIPGWQRIRQHILFRDNYTCQQCGAEANEVDHITPLSQGGSSKPNNLQALCTQCNAHKNYNERTNKPTTR